VIKKNLVSSKFNSSKQFYLIYLDRLIYHITVSNKNAGKNTNLPDLHAHATHYYSFSATSVIPGPCVRVDKINSTTMVARWDPITEEYVTGDLLGYTVYVYATTYSKIGKTNGTSLLITDLVDWAQHYVYVSGYTKNKEGYKSTVYFYTCKQICKV